MSTLVQRPAPPFSAPAVMEDNTVREDFSLEDSQGRYRLLFFYPFDFSFVCPTELRALDAAMEAFRSRDCEVVGISTDSHFSHLAWKKTPVEDGGIGPVRFPLVADFDKTISRAYGVLVDESAALRATVLVDRNGIVRHMAVNDMDLGRSVPEILRTLDAVRHIDTTGELCPANWKAVDEASERTRGAGKPPAGIRKSVQKFDLRRG